MNKWLHVVLVAGCVLLGDQLSKLAVWHWLAPAGRVQIVPDFFDLVYVMNPGVAFGILADAPAAWRVAVLTGAALFALAIVFFLIFFALREQRILLWGLSLITGGAVGNIVDRVRLGAVIDFLYFYHNSLYWPAFNVADSAVTVGTALILIHLWRSR